MKTILITGINGFLGSHLAKGLSGSYNIIGLEYSLNNLFRIADSNFKVYSSNDNLESIFKNNSIFAVIHAATVYRRSNSSSLEALISTNLLLPVKLLELAELYESQIFINTDTFYNNPAYNYSYLPDYTLSKKHVIEWLKIITNKCKLINMKIFHMYGPGDSQDKFIPQMLEALKSNVLSIDLTEGEQIRDFIYIVDIIASYKIVLENYASIIDKYTEFEVGLGFKVSIKDLLFIIKDLTESSTELNLGKVPYRKNEIMLSIADNSKLIALGWNPKYTIINGIQEILKNSK